jgi:hydroxymethylbilane synthase
MKTFRIGTRGSKLALTQTEWVKHKFECLFPAVKFSITIIKTTGDKLKDAPLTEIGGKGIFIKEIEEALLSGWIDIAVHSLKDLPTDIDSEFLVAAIPEREDVRDALVSEKGYGIKDLPAGSVVGTSSLRRKAQLLAARSDLQVNELRGNLDTRLRKLKEGIYDAVIVAAAGLNRLNLNYFPMSFIPVNDMLPAPGQGALAIETRKNDPASLKICSKIEDINTKTAVTCERAFLAALQGGCRVPIGAFAEIKGGRIILQGVAASVDGKSVIRGSKEGSLSEAEGVGVLLAKELISRGADKIISEYK